MKIETVSQVMLSLSHNEWVGFVHLTHPTRELDEEIFRLTIVESGKVFLVIDKDTVEEELPGPQRAVADAIRIVGPRLRSIEQEYMGKTGTSINFRSKEGQTLIIETQVQGDVEYGTLTAERERLVYFNQLFDSL